MLEVIELAMDSFDRALFHPVSFNLFSGELLHLKGENGVGKTTLLRLLAGFLSSYHGVIHYEKRSIIDDLKAYQQHVCYVGHKTGVHQMQTAREFCLFELQCDPWTAQQWLDELGLTGYEEVPCGQLSFGQRRRVGLLRLKATRASLWLLDEPLIGLDERAMDDLLLQVRQHLSGGGLVVLTSHQPLPEAWLPHHVYTLCSN